MKFQYSRWVGPVVVVVVLALSIGLTFFSRTRSGLELDADRQSSQAATDVDAVPAEMRSLNALYRTINLVQKRYIDATRIDPRAMFISAMRAVQGYVAEVLVEEQADELIVRLGTEERHFDLEDIKTPWVLLQRAKEVFSFLERGLAPDDVDLKKVEYAAINGMLKTLDPHSVFLDPDHYRDMRDKTQGKFGGLGIVISIRGGVLTIISPIDGTPADLVGLKAGDQILKIDEASTVNMSLNDAVDLLRGDPGTKVTVSVLRKGWAESRDFEIVRAIVKVESLEAHMLKGHVGYLRIKDFQGNTAADFKAKLDEWKKERLRALVLDLRGCPGGLLESAIQVSDIFLESGVIVTTAGQGPTDRDVRRARASGDEPDYPVVVLIDGGSASASEILAGALKNHSRALIVGERTFGKGSVQVLYDFHDGSALKMTTAQYLTPGDISIQSVGVVPHVGLLPMRADAEMLNLTFERGYRESDLDHHFEVASNDTASKGPKRSLSYVWTPRKPKSQKTKADGTVDGGVQEEPSDEPEKFKPDFQIELARDLAAKMASTNVTDIYSSVLDTLLNEKTAREDVRLVEALKKLGVDWRLDKSTEAARGGIVSASFEAGSKLKAGTESVLKVAVTNGGTQTFQRLIANTNSDFRPLDDREFAFGQVAPGETVERVLKFKVPLNVLNQTSDVKFEFSAAHDGKISPMALRFDVSALDRPRFAYSYQINDLEGGNGDSRLQRGETVKLIVDFENVGDGKAHETYATLKNLSGKKLFIINGRAAEKQMESGERKRAVFEFQIKEDFAEDQVRIELGIADVDLRVHVVEKLFFPIESPLEVKLEKQTLSAGKTEVSIYESPKPGARSNARLKLGSSITADARLKDYWRVELDEDRIGWIATKDVEVVTEGSETSVTYVDRAPPKLVIDEFDAVVRKDRVMISGTVTDETRVRGVYIFVGDDKVYFEPNSASTPMKMQFSARLPLKKGLNWVVIVAEETADLDASKMVAIRRDAADGTPYLSPRKMNDEPESLGVTPANIE
jgi:carboxyl-terminal processing protease